MFIIYAMDQLLNVYCLILPLLDPFSIAISIASGQPAHPHSLSRLLYTIGWPISNSHIVDSYVDDGQFQKWTVGMFIQQA